MANININIGNFDCGDSENPFALQVNMGAQQRVGGDSYLLNYSWNSAMYDELGMSTTVELRYKLEGEGEVILYSSALPDNAVNYQIDLPPHDTVDLFFQFKVNEGSLCYLYRQVLYSEIITEIT